MKKGKSIPLSEFLPLVRMSALIDWLGFWRDNVGPVSVVIGRPFYP